MRAVFPILILSALAAGNKIQRDSASADVAIDLLLPCIDGQTGWCPLSQICCYAVDSKGDRVLNDEGRGMLVCQNLTLDVSRPGGYIGNFTVNLCAEGSHCRYNVSGNKFIYQAGCLYYL
jgi:hypothetical protein